MKTTVILSLAAVLAAGCVASNPGERSAPVAGGPMPDSSLGLAKGSVFDVPSPPAVKVNDSTLGERPALPRAYVIAPPRVPHGVADFLPITQKQNACLDCHAIKEAKKGEPTPLPPSHYVDYRNAPGRPGTAVAGARHVCVSCHVPTTDAPSLVENRFRQ